MTTTRPTTETDAIRIDLERTRQHLATTVQELSRQLNVPRRFKESVTDARHRAAHRAGGLGTSAKQVPARVRTLPARAKEMPAVGRRHPRATAAVGSAVVLGAGAAAWILGRGK